MDGQCYLQTGFDVVSQGLSSASWTSVTANEVPSQKNRTYAHIPYMYSNGERGGLMATYLVSAMARPRPRPNFDLWLNTSWRGLSVVAGILPALRLSLLKMGVIRVRFS